MTGSHISRHTNKEVHVRRMRLWVVGLFVMSLALAASATEGGGGAYPNGAEGFLTGALPPPGHHIIDYSLYYSADTLRDGRGNSIPIDFDLEVYGNVIRYVHVSKATLFGASVAQHIFVPFLNIDVTTPGGSDEQFGLGDLIVDPFILGWHKPPFHWATGIDIYVPVGEYDKDDIANVGRNYWTIEPVFACTYLDNKGYEVSTKFMYDVNFENDDTDYESGDVFHVDYMVAKWIKGLGLGIGGFYEKQITGDDGMVMTPAGPMDAGDNKGQQFGWGPAISYRHQNMFFGLKYMDETETENKPEGERLWAKFIYSF
jgi:hypothetical protein